MGRHDSGRTGDGFFFAGRLVEARDNVAANTTHGFVWMHRGGPGNPLTEHLDQPETAYGREGMRFDQANIHGFSNNEAFGTQIGLIVVKANHRQEHDVRSVFDGFTNWETSEGVSLSYTSHYTLIDLDILGTSNPHPVADAGTGIHLGSNTYDMTFNRVSVDGFYHGIDLRENDFTSAVTDDDIQHNFIDVQQNNVGTEYAGFISSQHNILSSSDLVEGRLSFDMTGDTTISYGETLSFDGIKTDSIGSIDRQHLSMDDRQMSEFYGELVNLLARDGYYIDAGGNRVMLVEDLIADRATGELLKFTHVITLAMSDSQLANLGAANNGAITLGGPAPTALDDQATTSEGTSVLIDVLANDSDPDGGAVRVDGIIDAGHGDVYLQDNGQILYRPYIGFEGIDSFHYWAADEEGNYSQATVTVEVLADTGI